MHLKTPKHLQQKSKLLKIRVYFFSKRTNFLIKCICQKVFSRPVKWLKKLCWWNRKQSRKIFKNWNLIFKKVYFSNLNQQMSMLKSRFSLKNSKICIYYLKILKICSYIHLFKKWSKHAFSYASMQMHNYPKPRRLDIMLFKK